MVRSLGILVLSCAALAQTHATTNSGADRVNFKLDTSEADAVLAILDKTASQQPAITEDWQRLFSSEPYVRLKKREASMHRDFSDEDFREFVLSADLLARRNALKRTVQNWKKADLRGAAERILPYLPSDSMIRASVYPVIKPKNNSFVFETATNPAIFLNVDPETSQSAFENTVSHEMHHVGLTSATAAYDKATESAPEVSRPMLQWIGAFGEGLAILAAAGSPDVHPMTAFPDGDRIRWDQDMKYSSEQLAQLDTFFRNILRGGFKDRKTIDDEAFTFFGYRGPWYVVGYKMGAVIEKQLGRGALLEAMSDSRKLLLHYNEAAAILNKSAGPVDRLPLWSDEVVKAIKLSTN